MILALQYDLLVLQYMYLLGQVIASQSRYCEVQNNCKLASAIVSICK